MAHLSPFSFTLLQSPSFFSLGMTEHYLLAEKSKVHKLALSCISPLCPRDSHNQTHTYFLCYTHAALFTAIPDIFSCSFGRHHFRFQWMEGRFIVRLNIFKNNLQKQITFPCGVKANIIKMNILPRLIYVPWGLSPNTNRPSVREIHMRIHQQTPHGADLAATPKVPRELQSP